MANDDSEQEKDESTKQVDREALHKALNQSVDSREVLQRVNAQLLQEHGLTPEDGTAKVDRDAVERYLAAQNEITSDVDDATAGESAPPTPEHEPPPTEPVDDEPAMDAAPDAVSSVEVAPEVVAASSPPEAAPQSSEPARTEITATTESPSTSWLQSSTAGSARQSSMLWFIVVAAVGIGFGVGMALLWNALQG